MHYRELEPSAALRPFVRCFWILRAPGSRGEPQADRIVPDGCSEIVVNRADPFRRVRGGARREQEPVLLVGPAGRAITIAPTGEVDLFGIRFEPGGLHALLAVPAHELFEQDLCLGQVDGPLRGELERTAPCATVAERQVATERVLARRLRTRRASTAARERVRAAIGLVAQGPHSVEALAARLGTSRRALERDFRDQVGLSPKLYARVARLQAVLKRLEGGRPARGWAELAVACGFADQSHLIREFRLLAGTTPERHLRERTPLAACFEARDAPGGLSHSSNPRPAAHSRIPADPDAV